jgi:beta-D-xylosidase 4
MDCGSGFTAWMPAAVQDGSVAIADLASAAARNLAVRFRAGVFDDPAGQPMAQLGNESVCTPAAAALSLRAAEEGMVLLKNALPASGLGIPLRAGAVARLALIGGNANDTMMQLCSYYSTPCGGYDAMVSPLAALPAFVPVVDYAFGCDVGCGNTSGFAAAAAAAAAANATVVAVGLNCHVTGEGIDRGTLTLPGHQDDLVELACAAGAGRPCVIAVFAGAPLDLSRVLANPNVTSVIFAGYGGPQGGTALARELFGAAGAAPPAGRLTATWFLEAFVDEVDVKDMLMRPGPSLLTPNTTVPGRTYRFYSGPSTLLPFGFGLSLTTWRYANVSGPEVLPLAAAQRYAALGNGVRSGGGGGGTGGGGAAAAGALAAPLDSELVGLFAVNVTNTGSVDSDDVVLGFLVPPGAGQGGVPLLDLVGFERVFVRAGETVTVWLGVRARDLTAVDALGRREARAGAYTLRVGVGADEAARARALREASERAGGPPLARLAEAVEMQFRVEA